MRLLHVMAEMDPRKGGVGQAVRTMMLGLAEAGIHTEAVTLDPADASFITNNSHLIYALGPCKGPWAFSSLLFPWLTENIASYHVVIVHGLWLYHGYVVRKVFKKLKKKGIHLPLLFIMPHGMLDPYFQKASGRKLKAARNWLYWKLVEGKLINRATGLLFTSLEEQRLARIPFRPYHPQKEEVIGLGIEEPPVYSDVMNKAFSERLPELSGCSYILFLGRIDEKKGVNLLIDAYIRWCKKQLTSARDTVPKLVIAGPGIETSYGDRLKKASAGFEAEILFPGMLAGNAKWGAFYGCETFILPSHQENFGIAVVEALACGKPVLISNQVNICQEISLQGAGRVENDTTEGTYTLLEKWGLMSPVEKEKMGQCAIHCFQKYFSIGPATKRIIDCIDQQ